MRLRFALAVLLVGVTALAFDASAQSGKNPAAASISSMDSKLAHLQQNAAQEQPNPAPTEFTEREVNDYFAAGKVKLPAGVHSVRFEAQPSVITGISQVDFDQLKAGQRSSNPLLSVFSGVHDVVVVAHAHGAGHQGYVEVDSVSLDGTQVPRFALELFVDKYLKPKYPELGLNSRFDLPDKIDTATVGHGKLTVTQK
jgi:hypothetical protein